MFETKPGVNPGSDAAQAIGLDVMPREPCPPFTLELGRRYLSSCAGYLAAGLSPDITSVNHEMRFVNPFRFTDAPVPRFIRLAIDQLYGRPARHIVA
jgi:hypothetical protein